MRGRDRLDGVVEDDALDHIADIAAVDYMRDIGHWNNDEAAGVGRQCRLDALLNGKEWQWICVVDAVNSNWIRKTAHTVKLERYSWRLSRLCAGRCRWQSKGR